ncbi:hypothetical protein TIFTF001_014043 [Ficus carica]|uniref:Uncharacterized protein n=1 Tax=Ficus carica TaxID=3494 RepID=A0AA88D595_FICCA|nr:hypothetical protein TIFTF001_014043 [Ficus carica]
MIDPSLSQAIKHIGRAPRNVHRVLPVLVLVHIFSGHSGVWRQIPQGQLGFLIWWPDYGDSLSTHSSDCIPPNIVSFSLGSLECSGHLYARPLDLGFLTSQLISTALSVKSLRLLPPAQDRELVGAGFILALVVLVSLLFHGLGEPCAVVLCRISCKRKAPRSKGDTSEVSAKGTLMFKSVSGTDKQVEERSFDKENSPYLRAGIRYNGRYRTSGVRWYGVVGVECYVIVLLLAGTRQRDKGNAGRPPRWGSSHGLGSVVQVVVDQLGDPGRAYSFPDLSGLVESLWVVESSPISGKMSLLVLAHLDHVGI